MFQPDKTLIIAVSGGADSVALFHILLNILPRNQLVVAHFNHRWREEDSMRDEAFVRQLCEKEGITFHIGDVLAQREKDYLTEAG
ncbi:MAG TPA: tRNA(Ile)-lysidine synthetase, partial [Clostridiaceae bacterium]|nr:tRNA(Ile)-lysidine synthetase [Clostridiaceae bacterium]